jgi:uncharacterized RDD family membrane protein YckC
MSADGLLPSAGQKKRLTITAEELTASAPVVAAPTRVMPPPPVPAAAPPRPVPPLYFPPAGAVQPPQAPNAYGYTVQFAGFWERFGALFVDGLIVGVGSILLLVLLGVVGLLLAIAAGLAYFIYFEGGDTGQTPGKRALSIRVVDHATGASIGHGRAFGRYLGRMVSSFAFDLGYFWMLWDPNKQTWHDKLVGSVVVRAPR